MLDIRDEFTRFCGPSVLFVERVSTMDRTLRIKYSIPALEDEPRFVVMHLRNGLESVLRKAVHRAADSARLDAYRRTGHRDADMKQLLSGRTI